MSATDYLAVTERFVAAHFPGASIAIMAGSTARGERTATSDQVILKDSRNGLRETLISIGRSS